MSSQLLDLFRDMDLANRISRRLPHLFQLAELESSRAGKIGMEVGSVRERILIALLIYKFGEENVETEIPITEAEVDSRLCGQPLSIKTITGRALNGVKLIWTVDAVKALEFYDRYDPACDIMLVQINWGGAGGLFYFPLEAQRRVFHNIGRERYIKLPKAGTNPRGVEISKEALESLANDRDAEVVPIIWTRDVIDFNPYTRWLDHWKED